MENNVYSSEKFGLEGLPKRREAPVALDESIENTIIWKSVKKGAMKKLREVGQKDRREISQKSRKKK